MFDDSMENFGRLEICHDGYWGSVCDDIDVNNNPANTKPTPLVACRELGYVNTIEGNPPF